jgi:hypothetical protein
MSLYLKAAEAVAASETAYSCVSILKADRWSKKAVRKAMAYSELFSPWEPARTIQPRGWWVGKPNEKNQNCRVLALLFMHWMSQ